MTDDQSRENDARTEAFDWCMRIHAEPNNVALKREFDRWCAQSEENRLAHVSVMRMLTVAKELPANYANVSRRSWDGPVSQHRYVRPTFFRAHPYLAAGGCAVLVVLCVALFGAFRAAPVPGTLYETAVAETREIPLADGSTLFLDADSQVRAVMSGDTRSVELLGGQAYFDVVPDHERPFVVEAAELTVTVTGTRFAVSNRGDRLAVAVESGSVEVAHVTDSSSLSAGDRVSLHRSTRTAEKASVDPRSVGSFRTGRVLVENVPFGEFIAQLDAYYDGEIWLSSQTLADKLVSGSFDLEQPVAALRAAAGSQNASVRQLESDVLAVFSR